MIFHSGSRQAKMTKKIRKFNVWICCMAFLESERGFFWGLEVLLEGLRIIILQFFFNVIFFLSSAAGSAKT
jgi:hypothetical protein